MEIFLKALGFLALIIILAILMAFPVMWLWNWLMPELFDLTKINLGQAVGLMLLSSILFKNTNTNYKNNS